METSDCEVKQTFVGLVTDNGAGAGADDSDNNDDSDWLKHLYVDEETDDNDPDKDEDYKDEDSEDKNNKDKDNKDSNNEEVDELDDTGDDKGNEQHNNADNNQSNDNDDDIMSPPTGSILVHRITCSRTAHPFCSKEANTDQKQKIKNRPNIVSFFIFISD